MMGKEDNIILLRHNFFAAPQGYNSNDIIVQGLIKWKKNTTTENILRASKTTFIGAGVVYK